MNHVLFQMKYFLVLILISASTAIHYPTSYSSIVQHLDSTVPYTPHSSNPFFGHSLGQHSFPTASPVVGGDSIFR